MNKTFWQYLVVTLYFIGCIANIGAWISLHNWLWSWFILTNFVSLAIAGGCVLFKPVRAKS